MLQLVSQIAVCLFALFSQLRGRLLEDPGEGVKLCGQRTDRLRATPAPPRSAVPSPVPPLYGCIVPATRNGL